RQLASVQRDRASGIEIAPSAISDVEREIADVRKQLGEAEERWKNEKAQAEKVIDLRKQLEELPATDEQSRGGPGARLEKELADLATLQGEQPLVPVEVDPNVVAQVISGWTGIPVGSMLKDEARTILDLERRLGERIKGQDHAIKTIAEIIRASKLGLSNPESPLGVFLLVGPSGVGKTETSLGIADLLIGGERFVVTINISEFQEKHSV